MVLLVVDTQKLITTPDLYNFNAFECAVKSLIAAARENNVEVIYVRHDDGAGAELTKGTPGFETVFSPGYTTKKRGWGLGLSLARRIVVEYHSGRIFVKQSEINKGTIFRIELKK